MYKTIAGTGLGIIIPIGVEFGTKGAKLMDKVKYSAVAGLALGIPTLGYALYDQTKPVKKLSEEDRQALASFGTANTVTGACIWLLDELRKRGVYAFKQGGTISIRRIPSRRGLEQQGVMEEEGIVVV